MIRDIIIEAMREPWRTAGEMGTVVFLLSSVFWLAPVLEFVAGLM